MNVLKEDMIPVLRFMGLGHSSSKTGPIET
jgi:hypothetical protein